MGDNSGSREPNPQAVSSLTGFDQDRVPVCSDYDADCDEVPDKLHCWLYDPAKGRCPYLTTP